MKNKKSIISYHKTAPKSGQVEHAKWCQKIVKKSGQVEHAK